MSRAALQITRNQVQRCILLQSVVVITVAAGFLCLQAPYLAQSVILGGLLSLIPNWLFARIWLGYFRANAASHLVKLFYIAEIIKLVLTGILFVLMLKYLAINMLGCLIGLVSAQLAFWLAPWLLNK